MTIIIKHVDKIIEQTESGVTDPLVGIIENKRAIIKIPLNKAGINVLINEIICLKLCNILNIPMPDGGICIIDDTTDANEFEQDYEISLEEIKGTAFYLYKLENIIELVPMDLKKLKNSQEIIKVIVFDHFINNADRHDGNILIDIIDMKFYVIDHSHVFCKEKSSLGQTWALYDESPYNEDKIFKENEDSYNLFCNLTDYSYDDIMNQALNYKNLLSEEVIMNILNDIPDEWITEEKKNNIFKYIMHRISIIDDICKYIYKKINFTGGELSENSLFSTNV